LDKTNKKTTRTLKIEPIKFKDASIEWVDLTNDIMSVEMESDTHFGRTNLTNVYMQVFEDINRTKISEVYNIIWNWNILTNNFSFVQNDVHLSPYRRLVVYPQIAWDLGTSTTDITQQKFGRYVKNTWQEGYDKTTSMGIAFIAWFAGLLFLILYRPGHKQRQPRIFIENPKSVIYK
jgi:hypothetical protein